MAQAALISQTGDDAGFSDLAYRHRSELQAHCRRMLGSLEESEDLVQETFLRAWRSRASFRGPSPRAWLYRIATNACLDTLERRRRRPVLVPESEAGTLLDRTRATGAEPDAAILSKDTLGLEFMTAIQQLPQKQRAVLVLRGVLEWSSRDAAALLGTSVASVDSALQRARQSMRRSIPADALP
jgi:RNA polymerase sigma-70 factor, ECF subfamily